MIPKNSISERLNTNFITIFKDILFISSRFKSKLSAKRFYHLLSILINMQLRKLLLIIEIFLFQEHNSKLLMSTLYVITSKVLKSIFIVWKYFLNEHQNKALFKTSTHSTSFYLDIDMTIHIAYISAKSRVNLKYLRHMKFNQIQFTWIICWNLSYHLVIILRKQNDKDVSLFIRIFMIQILIVSKLRLIIDKIIVKCTIIRKDGYQKLFVDRN
jgi:hypothetical protein